MLPELRPASLPFRPRFFYGWVIVFVSAMGIFFSGPGQTYSVSVFVDPLIEHFGWSRSLVSSLYSGGTLCAGLLMTWMGRMVDRHGHRRMLPAIASLFAVALVLMSFVFHPVMLFFGFMLIRLLGQGSMTLVSSTMVPQWFFTMRGRAMSLVALGGALSTALVPRFNTWLIETYTWQIAWQLWAVLLVLVMAPLAWLLVRDRPEQVGLLPDNGESRPGAALGTVGLEEESWTLPEALRTRAFWILVGCTGIPSMINTGLIFHQVSILGERGLSPAISAMVFSVAVLFQLPSNFAAGYLMDRVAPRFVLAGLLAGHIVLTTWILYTDTVAMAIGMGVLRGVLGGVEGIMGGVLWPAYFGRKYLGSIRGAAMTTMVIGSALGPLPFGIAFDYFGGYREIILLMLLAPIIGSLAAMFARPPRKEPTVAA